MLGILPRFPFAAEAVPLTRGSLLVAYSDGITEAKNVEDEPYELERLLRVIGKHRDRPAQELIDEILHDVQAFTGDAPQSDDMTLLVLRRL